jgi:hypothetical protein
MTTSLNHPDKGGDPGTFALLKQAYEQACSELGITP